MGTIKVVSLLLAMVFVLTACNNLPQTIHVVERATRCHHPTLAPKAIRGRSAHLANDLFGNSENKVGIDNGYCVRTVVASVGM